MVKSNSNEEDRSELCYSELYYRWRGGVSLRQLARETGIPRSTLQRHINPFKEKQDRENRAWKWSVRRRLGRDSTLLLMLAITVLLTVYIAAKLLRF